MSREHKGSSGGKRAGIRLNHLNIIMICIGLVLATLMAVSMYRTQTSVGEIVTVSNDFLTNQQTGGMLREIASGLGEQAMAFVQSGDVAAAKAYEGQMNAINAQLEQHDASTFNSVAAGEAFGKALDAFYSRNGTERTAMRLVADTMPQPAFEALPAFLQETELSAEDQALSAEAKKEKAVSLLTAESYTGLESTIRDAIDDSHRLSVYRRLFKMLGN